jgi:hypothetical protein
MSCTNDSFQLERDIPGIFVSFHVPSSEIQKSIEKNETIEINYKRLFRRFTGRKRSSVVDIRPASTSNSTDVAALENKLSTKPSNRYETLIDRLERKYYNLSNVQSSVDGMYVGSEGEDSMSSTFSSNQASPDKAEEEENEGNKKRKKSKAIIQDYDYNDPFIDDTDVANEIDQVISTKKLKTKHDGFFVSSGELEVVKVPLIKKVVSKPVIQTGIPSAMTSTSSNTTNPLTHQKSSNLSVNTTALPSNTSLNMQSPSSSQIHSQLSTSDNSLKSPSQMGQYFLEETVELATKKEKIEKPAWEPKPEVLAALEVFKGKVEESGIRLSKKSDFPSNLEDPLLELDLVVRQYHSPIEIGKTTGYYETIQSYVGKGYSASKFKTIIIRTQFKKLAKLSKDKLQLLIHKLQNDLRANIIECPIDKQPANKKKRSSSTSGVINLDQPEGSNSHLSTQPELGNSNTTEASTSHPVDVSMDVSDMLLNVSHHQEKETNESKPLIEYKWYCRWNIPLRQQLLEIENVTNEWVVNENSYRDKLFSADKKAMLASEVILLSVG